MAQWRHRLGQWLLRHHAPTGAGHGGEPGEHFHAEAVGQLPGTTAQGRQLVDQCIAFNHRPHALAVGVVQQTAVAVDHVQVGTILVEMLAQQAVEDVAFTQVQAAADIPQVAAIAVENGLRQRHHQVVGRRYVGRRHQWAARLQRLLDTGRMHVAADQVPQRGGGNRQQHPVGIDHEGGIEGHALAQDTLGLRLQGDGVTQLAALHASTERQLLQGIVDKGLGDACQLHRIHPVGFQGMVDQQLALHPVAGEVAGAQHDHGGKGAKHQNECA
ncbi:hypothetical protein D3C72_511440 [compost metagenome]